MILINLVLVVTASYLPKNLYNALVYGRCRMLPDNVSPERHNALLSSEARPGNQSTPTIHGVVMLFGLFGACYLVPGFTLVVRLANVMNPVWATIRCWGLTLSSLVCQKRKRLSMVWM